MKSIIKKYFLLILVALAFLPINTYAKECSSFSVDNCPSNSCQVEGGSCVKAHIGQNFCSQKETMDTLRVVGYFLLVIRIVVPFIVIIFGSFDLFKAVTGGDEKSLSASAKKLGFRFLIGFSIFLVPTLIHIVLSGLNSYEVISDDANVCQTCLLKPGDCEDGVPSDADPFDDELFQHTEPVDEDEEDEGIIVE